MRTTTRKALEAESALLAEALANFVASGVGTKELWLAAVHALACREFRLHKRVWLRANALAMENNL